MKKRALILAMVAVSFIALMVAGIGTSTIFPLDEDGNVIRADLDAEEENYLDTHWNAMMDEVNENAVDLQELLGAATDLAEVQELYGSGSGKCFTVTGSAEITEINTDSQAGYVVITPEGYSGKYELQIQIGPVFKGTAVRDSLTCIGFSDFDNQMEWSTLSGEIMDKIYNEVLSKYDPETLMGKAVTLKGCFSLGSSDTLMIQPVEFEVE